jgi:hypothetical protein
VPIQACIDEAGVQNTDEVFVLAGFLNTSDRWREFSEAWRRCMNDSPAISHFHMLEAASLSGQFTNWRRAARDAKVRLLVEVAKAHGTEAGDCRAIYFTTPFNVFEKRVVADIASKTLSAPYLWGLFLTMFAVHNDLSPRGARSRFRGYLRRKQGVWEEGKNPISPDSGRSGGKSGDIASAGTSLQGRQRLLAAPTVGHAGMAASPNMERSTQRIRVDSGRIEVGDTNFAALSDVVCSQR